MSFGGHFALFSEDTARKRANRSEFTKGGCCRIIPDWGRSALIAENLQSIFFIFNQGAQMIYLRKSFFVAAIIALTGIFYSGIASAARYQASVASTGPGSAGFIMWGGLAGLVTKDSKTVALSNMTTRGAVEDLRLIELGKADFAIGVSTMIVRAQKATKPFKKKHTQIRGVGPGTVSIWHVVTYKNRGIRRIEQLQNKGVNFARKGSNVHYLMTKTLEFAGVKARPSYLPYDVAADAMKDNRIQAFGIPNPIPSPAVVKAATAGALNILPITGKVKERLLADNPAYFSISIPAGSYNGVDKDVPSIGYPVFTVAGAKVPAKVVYEVTRINYSKAGRNYLSKVHKGWLTGFRIAPGLANMAAIGLKLHPGAERYWKEQGHKIPPSIAN